MFTEKKDNFIPPTPLSSDFDDNTTTETISENVGIEDKGKSSTLLE